MREMRREHQQLIEIMSAAVGVDISQGKPVLLCLLKMADRQMFPLCEWRGRVTSFLFVQRGHFQPFNNVLHMHDECKCRLRVAVARVAGVAITHVLEPFSFSSSVQDRS